jgi:hypothetical protein
MTENQYNKFLKAISINGVRESYIKPFNKEYIAILECFAEELKNLNLVSTFRHRRLGMFPNEKHHISINHYLYEIISEKTNMNVSCHQVKVILNEWLQLFCKEYSLKYLVQHFEYCKLSNEIIIDFFDISPLIEDIIEFAEQTINENK